MLKESRESGLGWLTLVIQSTWRMGVFAEDGGEGSYSHFIRQGEQNGVQELPRNHFSICHWQGPGLHEGSSTEGQEMKTKLIQSGPIYN